MTEEQEIRKALNWFTERIHSIDEEDRPIIEAPHNKKAWMGQSAISTRIHKEAGLDGVRCGCYMGPWVTIRAAIGWFSVTCSECLKLRKEWEPNDEPVTGD